MRLAPLIERWATLLSFLLGSALSLAFAPFELFPLAVLSPAALFLLWQSATPRRAAWLAFWFGLGTFLAGTYWLYTSVHTFGQAPVWVAFILMLGLVAIMGLYHALVGYSAQRWLPRHALVRWLLGVPAMWLSMEWLRGWVLSGFPWLALGYSQIDSWLVGYAPVGGVYLISLLVLVSAGAIVVLLRGTNLQRAVAGGVFVAIWIAGALLARIDWAQPVRAPISVSLVQGAISQDLKWQAENRDTTLRLYRDLTEKAFGSQIIVWPEAALPALEHELKDYLAALYRDAQAHGSDLIIGILRYDFSKDQFRNSIVAVNGGLTWYDKRRLVPFGEFFPVPPFVRKWMRLMSLPYVDMTPGDPEQPPLVAAGEKLGATICYEDAYGNQQLAVLKEATLLVNVSNDAWFGDSTAPHQHLEIARMRAREASRYMLRATNNGITVVIDPRGAVVQRLPQFAPGILRATVQPRTGLTPYAKTGNTPLITFCLLLLVATLALERRRALSSAKLAGSGASAQPN
jgi:apolipoprotein N-acyltransferase